VKRKLSTELKLWLKSEVYQWPKLLQRGSSVKMVYLSNHAVPLTKGVSAPIVGLNSVQRIKEAVQAVDIELTEEEIKHLEGPYASRSVSGHS